MGKQGDLWDDSALIKAFDGAISKYKLMHGIDGLTQGEMADNNTEESLPVAAADNESNGFCSLTECVQTDDNIYAAVETTAKIGETANLFQIKENRPLEFGSSTKHADSSNSQTGNLEPTSENPAVGSGPLGKHVVSSDVKSQNEAAWYSNGQVEYSQLLNKYYEIEDQRQKILHQLNQYSSWNYQNPVSSTSTPEEYQASDSQPYDSVTCYCSYGCQNWIVPCNSLPASCSCGTYVDKSCNAISKGALKGNSMSQEDSDFVKMAMDAAKRAMSSLTQKAPTNADVFANEGKDKEFGLEKGQFTESTKPATDLAVVLNAWYSAGFYTGKYLSEQSFEKRKDGQDL